MARKFAQVKLAIWDDDAFRSLSPRAQHLFFVLITSPTINLCGVADWRPGRIAAQAGGWTADAVQLAATELIERLYIVVDEGTEEVLVRSFVRHDELMKQPRMATGVANAHRSVASPVLRGVIVHEINRLRAEEPSLSAWAANGVEELLARRSVDPSTFPLGKGSGKGFDNGCGEGSGKRSDKGSGKGSRNPKPTLHERGPVTGPEQPAPNTKHLTPDTNSASLREAAPPATDEITAQTVIGVWVDAARGNGTEPSKAQIGQVGKIAKELLGKNDPRKVLAAATAAGRKGFTPIDRELTAMAGRAAPHQPYANPANPADYYAEL